MGAHGFENGLLTADGKPVVHESRRKALDHVKSHTDKLFGDYKSARDAEVSEYKGQVKALQDEIKTKEQAIKDLQDKCNAAEKGLSAMTEERDAALAAQESVKVDNPDSNTSE